MSFYTTKLALVLIGTVAFTGTVAAQTAESGGASTGTATLAGPGQKAGASNQKAGGGSMKKMKMMHKKKPKHM